jgi:hypothetical protein
MFQYGKHIIISLIVASSAACGGSGESGGRLFETSRSDVAAFGSASEEVGLYNQTHNVAWDYQLGYVGFDERGSVAFGPSSSIPAERLDAYLAADATAEQVSVDRGHVGVSHDALWRFPTISCDANYCCVTTYGPYSEWTTCYPRTRSATLAP